MNCFQTASSHQEQISDFLSLPGASPYCLSIAEFVDEGKLSTYAMAYYPSDETGKHVCRWYYSGPSGFSYSTQVVIDATKKLTREDVDKAVSKHLEEVKSALRFK